MDPEFDEIFCSLKYSGPNLADINMRLVKKYKGLWNICFDATALTVPQEQGLYVVRLRLSDSYGNTTPYVYLLTVLFKEQGFQQSISTFYLISPISQDCLPYQTEGPSHKEGVEIEYFC